MQREDLLNVGNVLKLLFFDQNDHLRFGGISLQAVEQYVEITGVDGAVVTAIGVAELRNNEIRGDLLKPANRLAH